MRTRLVIDGVFFQLNSTGIARVWCSVLRHWAWQPYANEIVVLDRDGTAPKFPGLRYFTIPRYSIGQGDADRDMLQGVIDALGGELFASTYYTSVPRTKALQVVYDMIPEVMGWNIAGEPAWVEKHCAFRAARHFICISENTRRDLLKFFPQIAPASCRTVHLGVDRDAFHPPSSAELIEFHHKYKITRPYFMMVGSGDGYKNGHALLEALNRLPSQHGFEVLMVTRGGVSTVFREFIENGSLRILPLSDHELSAAYGGAVAFVYPSLYEGFGLPILEAMSCHCPVISSNRASLSEVGGDAVLYANTVDQIAEALCEVQKPTVQSRLISAGRDRANLFSWDKTATEWWRDVCALTEGELYQMAER
jgi:glycosyltransferase involved in cell wall biosynthesis